MAEARRRPVLEPIRRRGPVLRPSTRGDGTFGLDLTAGCLHACVYCYIRGMPWFPGEGRIRFDPATAGHLEAALDAMAEPPRRVVLSPWSDPLPPLRAVREAAVRAAEILLGRGIETVVMTRGRLPGTLIEVLAKHRERAKVAVGLCTLGRDLARALEPGATRPSARLRGMERASAAGVAVEARVEPLIAGLTDTRENLRPLLEAIAASGAVRVVTHYAFLHPSMATILTESLRPFGLAEKLADDYAGGPAFALGSLGTTKHLPAATRQEGLARLKAWGAEFGLEVSTGAAQNPDLKVAGPPLESRPKAPARRSGRKGARRGPAEVRAGEPAGAPAR